MGTHKRGARRGMVRLAGVWIRVPRPGGVPAVQPGLIPKPPPGTGPSRRGAPPAPSISWAVARCHAAFVFPENNPTSYAGSSSLHLLFVSKLIKSQRTRGCLVKQNGICKIFAPRGETAAGEAAPASLPGTARGRGLGNWVNWEKPCRCRCHALPFGTAACGTDSACGGAARLLSGSRWLASSAP